MTTRGLQINNPGNIRISSSMWKGKITPSRDAAFETFDTMEHGIRAMALLIINYYKTDKLDTIRKIVNKYAPPSDNNPTNSYVSTVADRTGFDPDAALDFCNKDDLLPVIKGMCDEEQGAAISEVTDAQFESGVDMALGSIPA